MRKFWNALYKEIQDSSIGMFDCLRGRKQNESLEPSRDERGLRGGLHDIIFGPFYKKFGGSHSIGWKGKLKNCGEYLDCVLFAWEVLRFSFLSSDIEFRFEGGISVEGRVCEGVF